MWKVFKVSLTQQEKLEKNSKNPGRKHKKEHARRQQEQHNSTKTTQTAFGICGRFVDTLKMKAQEKFVIE